MLRKALVLFTIVMLVSAVTAFACGDKTKSASADKAGSGEYACGSAEKTAVKSADADVKATVQTASAKSAEAGCPYMKANESGTHKCTAECASKCTAAKGASMKSASAKSSDCPLMDTKAKSASVREASDGSCASKCSKTTKSAEQKEAVDVDKTVMKNEKVKSDKL